MTRHLIAALLIMTAAAPTASSQTTPLEDYREVSYLVFARKAGFHSPQFSADLMDGSITIRFKRLHRGWRAMLTPQLSTKRKKRFFRDMTPIKENGRLVGIKIRVGVNPFSIASYRKRRPQRWILRVGEHRQMPSGLGPEGIPVVPYADLVETDAPDHDLLARAELAWSRGDKRACTLFEELVGQSVEVSDWAALRHADCLAASEQTNDSIRVLHKVVTKGTIDAARQLAKIRIFEHSGRALTRKFRPELYEVNPELLPSFGTAGDEIRYRAARTQFFRTQSADALKRMEALLSDRPRSPFFEDRSFLHALRWRGVRDNAREKRWLAASQTYLLIPPGSQSMEHWAELHLLGAESLREVGLPDRAVRIYLHLLQSKDPRVPEHQTIMDLAETYIEAGDSYRANVTLRFIEERVPTLKKHPRTLRLRGEISELDKDQLAAAQAAETMRQAKPAPDAGRDSAFIVRSAARALTDEGLPSARRTITTATGPAANEARRHLAMAAGDCDTLVSRVGPLALAHGEDMLWAGACLMGDGRYEEAVVMLEAARIYAPTDLMGAESSALLQSISEAAQWWQKNNTRLGIATASSSESQS